MNDPITSLVLAFDKTKALTTQIRGIDLSVELGKPGLDGDMPQMLCPVCGNDYVHHSEHAAVIKGNDNYNATPIVRGSVIATPMFCEEGHHFIFCLGFHKGGVFTWCVPRTDVVGIE